MPAKKTHGEYIHQLKRIHPTVKALESYINDSTPIKHKCLIHNVIHKSYPTHLLRGTKLPCCSRFKGLAFKTRWKLSTKRSRLPPPFGLSKPCLLFRGINRKWVDSYATIMVNGQRVRAYAFSLETWLGRPIKKGMMACHLCHNPACVEPTHLYEGTHDDNMRDKAKSGRASRLRGEDNPSAELSTETIKHILVYYKFITKTRAVTIQSMADKFNVSRPHMRSIIEGNAWTILNQFRNQISFWPDWRLKNWLTDRDLA